MTGQANRPTLNGYCDEYHLLKEISKTPLSTVYMAEVSSAEGEYYALKFIDVDFDHPADLLKREDEILQKLKDCRYVVKSRGVRQAIDGGIPYLVMDYVDGEPPVRVSSSGNIKQWVRPDLIRMYVKHIAEAIQCVHNHKICHCDIQPGNILIVREGEETRAVLCDFGLAVSMGKDRRYLYRDERDQHTPNIKYLPPERYGDQPIIVEKGDQYSLAAFVFEYLCGKMPSRPNSDGDPGIMEQIVNEIHSPKIGEVLEKALSGDMRFRYDSVSIFAEKLIVALDDYIAQNTRLSPSRSKPVDTPKSAPAASQVDPAPSNISHQPTIHLNSPDQPPKYKINRREAILLGAATLPGAIFLPLSWLKLWPRLFPEQPAPSFGQTKGVFRGHSDVVNAVSWSPDGQWIASASADETVQVWHPLDVNNPYPQAVSGNVLDVVWSNDNLIAYCAAQTVYVWEYMHSPPRPIYNAPGTVTALAWSPDSTKLALATENGIVQVLPFSGIEPINQEVRTISGQDMPFRTVIGDIAWSKDGLYLAACSDLKAPHLWIWEWDNNLVKQNSVQAPKGILSIAWSPMIERTLAIGLENGQSSDPNAQVFDDFDIEQPENFPHSDASTGITSIAWQPIISSSSVGLYLAAGAEYTGYVDVWNTKTKTIMSYDGHPQSAAVPIDIKALAWSPDGSMIASGGTDKTVRVWTSGS